MDTLKALIEKKRKVVSEEFHGKKYALVSELEEARQRKLREEEEQERLQKVRLCSLPHPQYSRSTAVL